MASSRRSRPAVSSGGAISGRPPPPASATQAVDHRGAGGRCGPSTSAWSSRSSDPQHQGVLIGDRQPHHHPAVVTVFDHGVGSQLGHDRPDSAPSTSTSTSISSPVTELPRIAGEGQVDVEAVGQHRPTAGRRPRACPRPVDPEGAGVAAVAVEADHVPEAVPEPEPGRVDVAPLAPVAELDAGTGADGVEQQGQGREARRPTGGRPAVPCRTGGAIPPRRPISDRASCTDRLTQMNAGDGQVQGSLLLRLQAEVGEVVGVGIDPVAELVVPPDGLHQHRDPLVAQAAACPARRPGGGHRGRRGSRAPGRRSRAGSADGGCRAAPAAGRSPVRVGRVAASASI